ncbi:adenylate/guanylate cyclase domain-containing protein [Micromonospora costi]|uniref:Guanylate cyclase domain-containing protein n=1 Tax=Micromonospora costi TaxID=1530042 RepID=A0A3A9ZZ44_9ACTN|nr:adenylate/guanylate cyclase domain-containing protein [Micromonospora costi]RKN52656.1 hypothetical protein D7193_22655 [Micromonospora costi]
MTLMSEPDRRLIMAVDMERYSRHDDAGQARAQTDFRQLMQKAAERCGLDRAEWDIQPTGDGELSLFPEAVSEPRIIAELVPAIDTILRDHNRYAASWAQVRLRVAIHQGLVTRTENGYAGSAVVTAARLVDATPLRDALKRFPLACVVMIVSSTIYRDVVSQSYSGIRADRYQRVAVRIKSFADDGWIFVPDENVNSAGELPVGLASAPVSPTSVSPGTAPEAPAMTGGSSFSFGTVTNRGPTVFGDHARIVGHTETSGGDGTTWR